MCKCAEQMKHMHVNEHFRIIPKVNEKRGAHSFCLPQMKQMKNETNEMKLPAISLCNRFLDCDNDACRTTPLSIIHTHVCVGVWVYVWFLEV